MGQETEKFPPFQQRAPDKLIEGDQSITFDFLTTVASPIIYPLPLVIVTALLLLLPYRNCVLRYKHTIFALHSLPILIFPDDSLLLDKRWSPRGIKTEIQHSEEAQATREIQMSGLREN